MRPSASASHAKLYARYVQWTTDELLAVLHPDEGYRQEAVEVAREILAEREVDPEQPFHQAVFEYLDRKHIEEAERREAPLNLWLRALCAILPGLPAIIVIGIALAEKRQRRAVEALQWMLIGIVGYTAVGFWLGMTW